MATTNTTNRKTPILAWSCRKCTFFHNLPAVRCAMCGELRHATSDDMRDFVLGVGMTKKTSNDDDCTTTTTTVATTSSSKYPQCSNERAASQVTTTSTAADKENSNHNHNLQEKELTASLASSTSTSAPSIAISKQISKNPSEMEATKVHERFLPNDTTLKTPQNVVRNPYSSNPPMIVTAPVANQPLPTPPENPTKQTDGTLQLERQEVFVTKAMHPPPPPQPFPQAHPSEFTTPMAAAKTDHFPPPTTGKKPLSTTLTTPAGLVHSLKPPPSSSAKVKTNGSSTKPKSFEIKPFEHGPVPFCEVACQTWIYPQHPSYPMRQYQLEMTETALQYNTLVSLPTGLGKTLIAAVVMYNFWRWFPTGKVIFLAPTLPLVHQQVQACYKIMGIPADVTAILTGKISPEQRLDHWKERRVFYCTPQTVQKDLENDNSSSSNAAFSFAKNVVCLVLDEAHKATGDYAYVKVIEQLERLGAKFRIVGLSATPGTSIKAIQEVASNLRSSKIEARHDADPSVQPYLHERHSEVVIVPKNDSQRQVERHLSDMLSPILERLRESGAMRLVGNSTLTPYQILQSKRDFCARHNAGGPGGGPSTGPVLALYAVAHKLVEIRNDAHQSLGIVRAKLIRLKNEPQRGMLSTLVKGDDFEKLYQLVLEATRTAGQVTLSQQQSNSKNNPKLAKLKELLDEHFCRAHACGKSSRVIVFSQFRDSVAEIVLLLRTMEPTIRPHHFVGQSKPPKVVPNNHHLHPKGKRRKQGSMEPSDMESADMIRLSGMKQAEQQRVIQDFRNDIYNVLVCTCIGEEGLDIGEVDLIVNYDTLKSPIRMIQRVGRTGRQRDGRVVCLIAEGQEEKAHQQSKQAEKTLMRALSHKNHFCMTSHRPLFPQPPVREIVTMQVTSPQIHWSQVAGSASAHAKRKIRSPNGTTSTSKKSSTSSSSTRSGKLNAPQEQERQQRLGNLVSIDSNIVPWRTLRRVWIRNRSLRQTHGGRTMRILHALESFGPTSNTVCVKSKTISQCHAEIYKLFPVEQPPQLQQESREQETRPQQQQQRAADRKEASKDETSETSAIPASRVIVTRSVMDEERSMNTVLPGNNNSEPQDQITHQNHSPSTNAAEKSHVVANRYRKDNITPVHPASTASSKSHTDQTGVQIANMNDTTMPDQVDHPLVQLDQTTGQVHFESVMAIETNMADNAGLEEPSFVLATPPSSSEDEGDDGNGDGEDDVGNDVGNDGGTFDDVICHETTLPRLPMDSSGRQDEARDQEQDGRAICLAEPCAAQVNEDTEVSFLLPTQSSSSSDDEDEDEANDEQSVNAEVIRKDLNQTFLSGSATPIELNLTHGICGPEGPDVNLETTMNVYHFDCPEESIGVTFATLPMTQTNSEKKRCDQSGEMKTGGNEGVSNVQSLPEEYKQASSSASQIQSSNSLVNRSSQAIDSDEDVPLISLRTKRKSPVTTEGDCCKTKDVGKFKHNNSVSSGHSAGLGMTTDCKSQPFQDLHNDKDCPSHVSKKSKTALEQRRESEIANGASNVFNRAALPLQAEADQPLLSPLKASDCPAFELVTDENEQPRVSNVRFPSEPLLTSSHLNEAKSVMLTSHTQLVDNCETPDLPLAIRRNPLKRKYVIDDTERQSSLSANASPPLERRNLEETPPEARMSMHLEKLEDTPEAKDRNAPRLSSVAQPHTVGTRGAGALTDTPENTKKLMDEKQWAELDLLSLSCRICFSRDSLDDDPIIICDGCNLGFHQKCFPVEADVNSDAPWLCDSCKYLNHGKNPKLGGCMLCSKAEGPLKRVAENAWCHPVCQPFVNADSLTSRTCQHCSKDGGVRCFSCTSSMHPSCAINTLQQELWTIVRVGPSRGCGPPRCALFCPRHAENVNTFITLHFNEDANGSLPSVRVIQSNQSCLGEVDTAKPKQLRKVRTREAAIAIRQKPIASVGTPELKMKERKRQERRQLVSKYILDEAEIRSDDDMYGDEDEEEEVRRLEEEEGSDDSFINDSLELTQHFSQDNLHGIDPDATDDADYHHRALDAAHERENIYKTPLLNRRMQQREETGLTSSSQKGLGNMHFIRSVLEHHRQGGTSEEIEQYYHKVGKEAGLEEEATP